LGRTENKGTCDYFKIVQEKETEMDIIKLSTDWAKAVVFLAKIVWLFS